MKIETKKSTFEEGTLNYAQDANAGYEGITSDDLKIPFLTILQALSPEVQARGAQYVQGAQPGMIINTVTGKVYDAEKAPLVVIPVGYHKAYVEWVPRNKGGGFIRSYGDSSILDQTHKGSGDESTRDILPNGNYIETTAYHSVMVCDGEEHTPAIIAMSRTQLKHSRAWLTMMHCLKMKDKLTGKTFTPAMYAYHWNLTTIPEESNNGQEFFSWKVTQGSLVTDAATYREAQQLSLNSSRVRPALQNTADQDKKLLEVM